VLDEVIVEGVGGEGLEIGGGVAGPAHLDGPAVGPARPAGPIQRRLQRRVLRVVLRHAPKLPVVSAVAGDGDQKREQGEQHSSHGHFFD